MVAKISQKLKHKSLITVLVSLAVIGVYYFVYFKVQSLIQDLLANATVYGARIKGTAYPVYLFGSIGVGDIRTSVIVSVAVAVLFFLMWVLLSHSFLQIATSTGKVIHREYREKYSRQRSIDAALLGREISRFTASPNYMLNCGLASMNFMTAPSVSLEGKSIWLLQSLPVEPWRIFRAKISMQLLLTGLPLLLCVMCTVTVYSMYSLQLLMILLFGGSYVWLMALIGLFLGVMFMPGWKLGFCRYMSCFVGANLFLSAYFYLWLRKKGVARFSAL